MDKKELVDAAVKAREKSYCPYSHFAVGAALITEDGKLYEGANIENASYSLTVCAERTALFEAVRCGERSFSAIAIVGGDNGTAVDKFCPPCGACRQVLSEFCSDDLEIILFDGKDMKNFTLGELLPVKF